MALTAGFAITRRGPQANGTFGYYVAAGEKIFRGGIVAVNAAGNMVRPQTAGAAAIVGIADKDLDNSASASVSTIAVEGMRGIFQLPVGSATAANINATVYASDDNTLTLTNSGSLLTAGTISGIDGGATFVKMIGG